jgi:hypothetical protein
MAVLAAIPPPANAPVLSGPAPVAAPVMAAGSGPGAQVISMGGMRAVPLAVMEAERTRKEESEQVQASPIATGVAAHIKTCFSQAWQAKRNTVQPRLLDAIRSRRGEYDPVKLALIREQGGSEVFAGLTSSKCRAAGGWIRDVMMGTGAERPWSVRPTPVPDLPPEINEMIVEKAMGPIKEALAQGIAPEQGAVTQMMSMLRDQAMSAIREEADKRAVRMGDKMEDQLLEGGFLTALDEFIDDITTYPTAFLKGPIIRMKASLEWGPDGKPTVNVKLAKSWERVSPFDMYPSPGASNIQDGFLIQKHHLSRQDLNEMIGVDGYNEAAIRSVLEDFGRGGLISWELDRHEQVEAEGKDTMTAYTNPDGLIDAYQFWGSVQGSMLVEWGMNEDTIPDGAKEYHVEAWAIGSYVIKAVLNYDPLCRKPYYAASYERVPGNIWGNSVADLVRDPQEIVNACARSLVNNMALASGPQVGVLVDRLAPGEDITTLQPWRIWQMKSDPMNGMTQKPIEFFQPTSNVNDLLIVFDKFSQLGDEYSGIPRYLTGDTTGGAGRTASGLSMLISNAGKSIKQVINNIDIGVMSPLLDYLYYHNMRYEDDPDLKGDVKIIAKGASALVAKENAQVRRNEFLAATANPIDFQIVGVEGRAAVLHEVAKGLDMDADKVVPTVEVLRQKLMVQQALAGPGGAEPAGGSGANPENNKQKLMNGAPITDNFSPTAG